MKKRIQIIEVHSEIGAGTRGGSLGIESLKIAALNANSTLFYDYPNVQLSLPHQPNITTPTYPYAKHIESIKKISKRVCDEIALSLEKKTTPMVISGDHSTALGTISGIKKARPKSVLGVIWIDAHSDIHSPYTTPSGNMHGMTIAAALGEDNIEQKKRDINPVVKRLWNQMKNMGMKGNKICGEDMVYVGLRSFEKEEKEMCKKHNIFIVPAVEVNEQPTKTIVHKILDRLKHCTDIYISFDADSIDPSVSKGTGTPYPNGLNAKSADKLVYELTKDIRVCCFEISEVNPTLDKENRMSEVTFEILRNCVKIIEKDPITIE